MVYETGTASPRRQRKREARKAQILREALQIVARDGLGALTVQRLASELDYTPGALYRYVPSKHALLAELEAHALTAIHGRIAEELAACAEEPAGDRQTGVLLCLLAGASRYASLLDEAKEEIVLIAALMGEQRRIVPEADAPRVAPAFTALLRDVEELFREAADCGALAPGPARERTVAYWASLQGVVQLDKLSYLDASLFDPRRLVPETARALLAGWGADASKLERASSIARERSRRHVD